MMTTRARLGRLAVVAALAAGSVIAVGGVAQADSGHDNVQADDGGILGLGDIGGGALGVACDVAGVAAGGLGAGANIDA